MNANPRKTPLSPAAFPIPHSALRTPHSKTRRGITLLFVMSMVVLFLLMGTTFVVVSNDYLRASTRRNRNAGTVGGQAISREEGLRLVEDAFHQVVRGPSLDSVDSPLRTHDLLGDLYGYGVEVRVQSAELHASTQFVLLNIGFDYSVAPGAINEDDFPRSLLTNQRLLSLMDWTQEGLFPKPGGYISQPAADQVPGQLSGQVVTVSSGELRGLTGRIISSIILPPPGGGALELGQESHQLVVQPLGGRYALEPDGANLIPALQDANIIINGKAFTGTGAGTLTENQSIDMAALAANTEDPNQVPTDAQKQQLRNYLINGTPNELRRQERDVLTRIDALPGTEDGFLAIVDGAGTYVAANHQSINEPWDAPDLQNMFLARMVDENGDDALQPGEIIPSFFRASIADPNEVFDAFRRTSLAAAKVVDNDNDGALDGLWMDLGMPIRSTADGDFIKPLVSVLVVDMDGRLNLNAHGNLAEIGNTLNMSGVLGTPTEAAFPKGLGFGPAEVSLGPVLDNGVTGGALSQSVVQSLMQLRYGNDLHPGSENEIDRLAIRSVATHPEGFITNRNGQPVVGSPVDLYGRTGLGFFISGGSELTALLPSLPNFATATPADPPIDNQLVNSPYEVNLLSPGSSNDRLFRASNLEHLFRPNDLDSQLLDRRLAEGDPADQQVRDPDNGNALVLPAGKLLEQLYDTMDEDDESLTRKLLTTHSFEIPAIPEDINRLLYNALTVAEDDKAELMAELLSPEVRRGLPMNLNRLFGNGRDDNQNNVIDEPTEFEEELVGSDENAELNLDVNNDGRDDSGQGGLAVRPSLEARQTFAKRLFVMMILLTEDPARNGEINDATGFFDYDGNGDIAEEDLVAHRKMLAQWCVNVVDFRDSDSIMTGVEFDLNPFDGWNVNGNLETQDHDNDDSTADIAGTEVIQSFVGAGSDYFVVWGVERPELLITETIALHDVRTQDTDRDASGNTTTDNPNRDPHFDSAFLPNASAFFELYNPWNARPSTSARPAELYDNARTGVDLARTAGTGANATPVWRLLVFDPEAGSQRIRPNVETVPPNDLRDSVDMDAVIQSNPAAVVRYAYFAEPGSGLTGQQFTGPKVYYPSADGVGATVLAPGQNAVVGSGGNKIGRVYTTYLGRTTTDAGLGAAPAELGSTQQLVLEPANGQTTWHPTGSTPASGTPAGDVAIALDTNGNGAPRSFAISDPESGYQAAASFDVLPIDDGFQIVDLGTNTPLVLDVPLDQAVAGAEWSGQHPLNQRGLVSGYRVVYLQRLANPLLRFDAETNPYRIVDSSSIDLFVFNGLQNDESTVTGPAVEQAAAPYRDSLSTYERSEKNGPTPVEQRLLWKTGVLGQINPTATAPGGGTHVLDRQLEQTLGSVNRFYVNNNAGAQPFAWLAWNNRLYANRFELANVPYTSAHWLTRIFGVRGAGLGDPFSAIGHDAVRGLVADRDSLLLVYHPNAAAFPHLLNFEADSAAESDRIHQVLDFVEVPSRFAGVNDYVSLGPNNVNARELTNNAAEDLFGYRLSAPFDELSKYRYPGKVNLNTIGSPRVWDALLGDRNRTQDGPYASNVTFDQWRATTENCPLRPAIAANYVSPREEVPGSANTGLFRSSDGERTEGVAAGGETDFLLAYHENAMQFNNTDRNAYFRNGIRQRLGGVATNRSSVFAIWVTVGYFEWDPETNNLRDQGVGGIEYGRDSGEVMRSRGFYLFDRSIPMAYEPGVDHNIDRGILLQSMIE